MAAQQLAMQTFFTGQTLAFRPAAASRAPRRFALTVEAKESRIGKKPIVLPAGVEVKVTGQHVAVKGPRGSMEFTVPDLVEIKEASEGQGLRLYKREESRKANELHGLARSLVNNMVVGTSDGFTKVLSMVGVGYRAATKGAQLTLNLGYSNPVELVIPEGLTVAVEKNTKITITGNNKELVGNFAAIIRDKRPPEPYKGKGVRYEGEVVRRKEGKKGK